MQDKLTQPQGKSNRSVWRKHNAADFPARGRTTMIEVDSDGKQKGPRPAVINNEGHLFGKFHILFITFY